MTNGVRAVLCVAALSITLVAQSEPVLLSANIPIYPPLAALARIEGIVKLTFTLRANGEPMNVQVVSGHAQLKN
jgi:outer membrane biosynthesis protein TonB